MLLGTENMPACDSLQCYQAWTFFAGLMIFPGSGVPESVGGEVKHLSELASNVKQY